MRIMILTNNQNLVKHNYLELNQKRTRRRKYQETQLKQKQKRKNLVKSRECKLQVISAGILLFILSCNIETNFNKQAFAFNVDTQSAIIHQGPEGSYFGYAVALHKDRGVPWLLVGAPQARTMQPGVENGGAVYKCSPNTRDACQQILFDQTGQNRIQLQNETRQSGDKSHQWFGASLHSATDNGSIVACAPLYVHFTLTLKRRDPIGSCFVSRGSFDGFMSYQPCKLDDQWGHHHMGSCQAGFSSAISKDGSRIFMGAPGSHVWQGQAFAQNLRNEVSHATSAVNPHSEDDSYLGYSLSLGKFSGGPSNDQSDMAIGIPRGAKLAGKVMLVDKDLQIMRNITGEQMGAYFGYSLVTVDVNGDGFDDLLIGAPLYFNQTTSHKEPHFERGRVYVATQNSRHEFTLSQRLDGHRNKARFGSSIANAGDLNKDGFQDVAIGAPYDGPDHRGAIYIYMGHKSGLSEEYDQVIYAEQLPRPDSSMLRSFGFSLSAGQDVDGNGYPDLLIGDYAANRAVVLKSRPVVNVENSLTFTPENFNLDDKKCVLPSNSSIKVPCITVTHCYKYNGLNVDNKLVFVHDVKLDTENKGAPRLFFLNSQEPLKTEDRNSSTLTKNINQCHSFKAYIGREIRDKLTPLKIDIDYNLADMTDLVDPTTNKIRLRPVLNKSQPNKMQRVASIQKNCGSDNICEPNLKLTMNSNINEYVIGSNEKIILDVTVRNYNEDAFESMFYLDMPMSINYENYNKSRTADYPDCYDSKPDLSGVNRITCDLGNPQGRNDVVKFSIITQPARFGQFAGSDFTFRANVNSTNPERERDRDDNTVLIGIPIKVHTDLILSGNSQPTLVVHNSSESLQPQSTSLQRGLTSELDLGEEVYHTYQLQNKGPSTINDIALTILWPTKTKNGDFLLYLVEEPITSDNVKCKPSPDIPINPLGLLYQRGNVAGRGSDRTGSNEQVVISRTGTTSWSGRFKRDTEEKPEAAAQTTSTVDDSILAQLFSCGKTQCNRFECNVIELTHNAIASIKIRSRLYQRTLNTISQKEFDISSKLVAQIKALPYNVSTASMLPYVYEVKTQVRTVGLAVQDLLPWWLIVLAILLGIVLFVLLACFLRYLGFFARKRPPKSNEREPLTPTSWTDYPYSPGDTAL